MNAVYRFVYTSSASLLIIVSCFTTSGCRSARSNSAHQQGCQGGSCGVPLSSDRGADQSPAQLFAEMKYEEIADEQTQEANRTAIVARIPRGPDSLFAGMR